MAGRRTSGCVPTCIHPLKYGVEIIFKNIVPTRKVTQNLVYIRSFTVDCEGQVKCEHTLGKMRTVVVLKQVTCVPTACDNSTRRTRSVPYD